MKKLMIGITAPGSVVLIVGQMKWFKAQGYETHLMCPSDKRVSAYCKNEGCEHIEVKIERDIHLWADLKSLWSIYKAIRKIKPDIVNVGTPKMGLLGMVAAKLSGVKRRIYTCRGFRFEHEKGLKRQILVWMERIAGWCAQDIICISPSVRDIAVKNKVFKLKKCVVIHKGSSNGIDLNQFSPQAIEKNQSEQLRKALNPENGFLFGFVSRLVDRKGIKEMYTAFHKINKAYPATKLVIVGAIEWEQISDKMLVEDFNNHPSIIMTGSQKDVPLYLSIIDVFLLPSWWEGFGNVVVQAAAMGVAVISTTGTGTKDAVCDGFNGILVPIKDSEALYEAMKELMLDSKKRENLGKNGIAWAKNFSNEVIWKGIEQLYKGDELLIQWPIKKSRI